MSRWFLVHCERRPETHEDMLDALVVDLEVENGARSLDDSVGQKIARSDRV